MYRSSVFGPAQGMGDEAGPAAADCAVFAVVNVNNGYPFSDFPPLGKATNVAQVVAMVRRTISAIRPAGEKPSLCNRLEYAFG